MDPPANPQPIAALQTLASPQGASSSTEVRPVKAPPPPPPPAPFKALPMHKPPWAPPVPTSRPPPAVLVTNGVVAYFRSEADMPSAAVPVWPERNCPATHAAIARVPQPWVPYYCPHSMRIWIHNPEASTWAWWEPSSPVAQ